MIIVSIFLILAVGIVFASHYFIYFSLSRFFLLENSRLKIVLAVLLFFLPVSYILSSIVSRFYENGLIRFFYFASGVWLGLATTLVVFFAAAWLVQALARLAGLPSGLSFIGGLALVLAVGYCTYGVWNAYHPRIKNISVPIENLPSEWQGKKVIQISDVHLGHIFQQEFFEKVVRQINEQEPVAVFVTGDLFDGLGNDFGYIPSAFDAIKASKGIYFVTGNHETYFGLDKVREILGKTKLKVFEDDMAVVDGLQIIGINYPERSTKKDVGEIIKNIPAYDPEGPSILLFHSPTQIEVAKSAGINLQLSGHTHCGQILPFNYITWLIYHGYDYGLKTSGNYSIYTSSGIGSWGPTMRTTTAPEIVVITLQSGN